MAVFVSDFCIFAVQINDNSNCYLMKIQLKRVYETPSPSDGFRVLVDRLWPRGIKKENAHVDLWAKNIAPSAELRKWFGHVPERFPEFKKRYEEELRANPAWADFIKSVSGHDIITLLFAAKDKDHNNAVVIGALL